MKKTAHAEEQRRADVQSRRREWFAGQLDLDPTKLVFIDETGASTNLARKHERCRRGRRLRAAITQSLQNGDFRRLQLNRRPWRPVLPL
jgi:hypothetical protein